MAEEQCRNLSMTRKGETFCKVNEKELNSLRNEVSRLTFKLERAREIYKDMRVIAKRERHLNAVLISLQRQLKNIQISRGAYVLDLRERLEKAKKLINENINGDE
jgi:hypothetical protein